jgi:N-acetylneuraminic acid mutarotase
LKDGRPLLVGGFDVDSATAFVEVFDDATKAWSRVKSSTDSHAAHTTTYFPALDRVLVVGETNELYNPLTDTWTPEATPAPRDYPTATVLASGKVLIAGGQSPGPAYTLQPPALYDPNAAPGARWSPAGAMVKPRFQHAAVLLKDGKVLVMGGGDNSVIIDDSELYDPTTNTWSKTGSLLEVRADFGSVRLGDADGRVLVAGGFNGVPMSTAEIYDPKSKTWSTTTPLDTGREGPCAVLLSTGRVLLIGGEGSASATTTVFDPKTSLWSKGPALTTDRAYAMTLPLSGGRVLVIGGEKSSDGTTRTSTTEIFGGLASGATCVIDEECVSGACVSGKCSGATDAGSDVSSDTGAATDGEPGTPPDAGSKPVVSGSFDTCTSNQQCASGFCVDGVCCDSACNSPCQSCTLPWAPGHCTLEPYGTDKKNACGASGACVGTCDGKGGCTSAAAGTQCAVAKCTDAAKGVGPAVCAGKDAACNAGIEFDCTPFACEPALAACRSTCIDSAQCAPGYLCDTASRTCAPAPPSDDGGGCNFGRRESSFSAGFFVALALLVSRRRFR